ncbi:MAG: hypothetical protein A3G93_03010 [Nitrospinae bacterium RIFCSPLOWO2_12_FULL_45_22]|nr:MAG: hypothetical protein A3G93_03010 [Nitrospinae bacterium RIFCSPLOWO2_12_FULL_45_22]
MLKEGLFTYPALPGEAPRLLGSRCSACQAYFFPKRYLCPHCHKDGTMEEIRLSNKGTLYTYCIVQVAPEGFTAPYVLGYVDLPEGPRVYALITGIEPSALRIGMELELVIEPIRQDPEGRNILGYKFCPI